MKAYCPRCTLHSGDTWSQCEACRRQDEQEASVEVRLAELEEWMEEAMQERLAELEARLAKLEGQVTS